MVATLTRMGGGGGTKEYDTENPEEVAEVEAEFAGMVAAGWKAYDDNGDQVDGLNTQGETAMLPRLVGG